MANQDEITGGHLAIGVSERLEQLGMSRRELARRTGLSRQTIHNVLNEGSTNLKPTTFKALDTGLKWDEGTALAKALGTGSPKQVQGRVTQYLARIAVHLSQMSTEELELTLIMLEENQLGNAHLPIAEFTDRVGLLVEGCLRKVHLIMEDDNLTNGRHR